MLKGQKSPKTRMRDSFGSRAEEISGPRSLSGQIDTGPPQKVPRDLSRWR
jgi:hypothetical protein